MFPAILSVLLFGMLPGGGAASSVGDHVGVLRRLSIAPPAIVTRGRGELVPLLNVTASGVIVVDLQSGQTVYARDAELQRPMASLTKLMTALLIAERHDLRAWVAVPPDVTREGHVVRLPPGEHFTVGDLLTSLLVDSANDAADVLARFHSGSAAAFADEMNARARELGLARTSFRNPAGFDDPQQLSSARDVAWLATHVLRRSELRRRLSMRAGTIVSREGTAVALLQTHELLQQITPVIAGKTGTTDDAGQCLMSVVRSGGRDYLVVLLGSRERYADMRIVLEVLASLVS